MSMELTASKAQGRDKKQPSPSEASKTDKPKSAGADGYDDAARKLEPHPGAQSIIRRLLDGGEFDENALADAAFWAGNEALRGKQVERGSPEAQSWRRIRDELVRPSLTIALRAKAAKPEAPKPEAAEQKPDAQKGGGSGPTSKPVPAVKGEGPSRDDEYYTQSGNSYDDAAADWKGGSAGHNTCNMTVLTMALVSIAGADKVRENMAALLRKNGYRAGATLRAGKRTVSLAKALANPELLKQVQLEDLVTAAGVKSANSYGGVTERGTIAKIAKLSGLATTTITKEEDEDLWRPEVRAKAKEQLASGKRIVAGTKGHYVYLTEVLDDGIIVHDPAGLRVSTGSEGFIHPGTPEDKASTWLSRMKTTKLQTVAIRRAGNNDDVRAAMQRVQEVSALKGKAKTEALKAWKAEGGAAVETGKGNFYGLDELKEYSCRVRIVLDPTKKAEGDQAQAPPEKK